MLNRIIGKKPLKTEHLPIISGYWASFKMPAPHAEYKFHPSRKWRIDYAWPVVKLAVEIEGGVFRQSKGRHTNPSGFIKDIEKYNALTEHGWHLLRYIPGKIDCNQISRIYKMFHVKHEENK